jgi:hypothetical protein
MKHVVRMIDGYEYDHLNLRARRFHRHRAGTRAYIKRKFRRRERHVLQHQLAVLQERA